MWFLTRFRIKTRTTRSMAFTTWWHLVVRSSTFDRWQITIPYNTTPPPGHKLAGPASPSNICKHIKVESIYVNPADVKILYISKHNTFNLSLKTAQTQKPYAKIINFTSTSKFKFKGHQPWYATYRLVMIFSHAKYQKPVHQDYKFTPWTRLLTGVRMDGQTDWLSLVQYFLRCT